MAISLSLTRGAAEEGSKGTTNRWMDRRIAQIPNVARPKRHRGIELDVRLTFQPKLC